MHRAFIFSQYRKGFIRRFLIILGLFVFFFGSVLFGFYNQRIEFEKDNIRVGEWMFVDRIAIDAGHNQSLVFSDLLVISKLPGLMNYLDDPNPETYQGMLDVFLNFSRYRFIYEQVRFIDMSGKEVARVNYNDGEPIPVPKSLLQDKSDRTYFQKASTTLRNHIFISDLELNVENGKVEFPYNPVLRFATPVFNSHGEKAGIIVLNYLAKDMLKSFDYSQQDASIPLLVDEEGYYLFNQLNPHKMWGNSLPERAQYKFSNDYPEEWAQLNEFPEGQIETENGIFTFVPFQPSIVVDSMSSIPSFFAIDEEPVWKIVVVHRNAILQEELAFNTQFYLSLGGIFFALSVLLSLIFAVFLMQRNEDRMKLEHTATHDGLTGLPNRNLFIDRLEQSILLSKRSRDPIAVFVLDLDGFKKVNDQYGHLAGDIVLTNTARRIVAVTRGSDTAGRFGGDEFALLLHGVRDEEEAGIIAKRLLNAISEPIPFGKMALEVNASIGVFLNGDSDLTIEEIMSRADEAMYIAKNAGKNQFAFYSEVEKPG